MLNVYLQVQKHMRGGHVAMVTNLYLLLQEVVDVVLEDEPSLKSVDVSEVCLKTGNKIFTCSLSFR